MHKIATVKERRRIRTTFSNGTLAYAVTAKFSGNFTNEKVGPNTC